MEMIEYAERKGLQASTGLMWPEADRAAILTMAQADGGVAHAHGLHEGTHGKARQILE